VRLSAQKTRKLNPQPNLVTKTKGLAGKLENTEEEDLSLNQEENNIQDATVEKNENMKETRSSPPPAIPTKNRFKVLQPQETSLSQRQDHQTINYNKRTKNTKYDRGKHKKKGRRNAKQSKQADYVPGGNITHPRQNKGHTDKHPPTEEADNISN
jgi:hypothetical protein